jgi:hypothetical protein
MEHGSGLVFAVLNDGVLVPLLDLEMKGTLNCKHSSNCVTFAGTFIQQSCPHSVFMCFIVIIIIIIIII